MPRFGTQSEHQSTTYIIPVTEQESKKTRIPTWKRLGAGTVASLTLLLGACGDKEVQAVPVDTHTPVTSTQTVETQPVETPAPEATPTPVATVSPEIQALLDNPPEPAEFFKLPEEQRLAYAYAIQNKEHDTGRSVIETDMLGPLHSGKFENGKYIINYFLSNINYGHGYIPDVDAAPEEIINYLIAQEAITQAIEYSEENAHNDDPDAHDGAEAMRMRSASLSGLEAENRSKYATRVLKSLDEIEVSDGTTIDLYTINDGGEVKYEIVDGKQVPTREIIYTTHSTAVGDYTSKLKVHYVEYDVPSTTTPGEMVKRGAWVSDGTTNVEANTVNY